MNVGELPTDGSDAIIACGTGIEGCDELEGNIRNQCEEDPRQHGVVIW